MHKIWHECFSEERYFEPESASLIPKCHTLANLSLHLTEHTLSECMAILTQIWKTTKLEMHIDTKLRENGGSIYLNFILFNQVLWQMTRGGVGIAQWLVHQTHDQKVVGSNPCRSSGRIFFSGVNFLC